MATNTPEQQAVVHEWLGLPPVCYRCLRTALWQVNGRGTLGPTHACHFHLQRAITFVLSPGRGSPEWALVRRHTE